MYSEIQSEPWTLLKIKVLIRIIHKVWQQMHLPEYGSRGVKNEEVVQFFTP
jgi:hypothetical protein